MLSVIWRDSCTAVFTVGKFRFLFCCWIFFLKKSNFLPVHVVDFLHFSNAGGLTFSLKCLLHMSINLMSAFLCIVSAFCQKAFRQQSFSPNSCDRFFESAMLLLRFHILLTYHAIHSSGDFHPFTKLWASSFLDVQSCIYFCFNYWSHMVALKQSD